MINLKTGEVKLRGKPIEIEFTECVSLTDELKRIEELYREYKYSIPTKKSQSKRKHYFKALPIEEIPDMMLLISKQRDEAEWELIKAVLNLKHSCIAKEQWDYGWFYKGTDPDFIILKDWLM